MTFYNGLQFYNTAKGTIFVIPFKKMAIYRPFSYYHSLAKEGANLGGKGVEVVETKKGTTFVIPL